MEVKLQSKQKFVIKCSLRIVILKEETNLVLQFLDLQSFGAKELIKVGIKESFFGGAPLNKPLDGKELFCRMCKSNLLLSNADSDTSPPIKNG